MPSSRPAAPAQSCGAQRREDRAVIVALGRRRAATAPRSARARAAASSSAASAGAAARTRRGGEQAGQRFMASAPSISICRSAQAWRLEPRLRQQFLRPYGYQSLDAAPPASRARASGRAPASSAGRAGPWRSRRRTAAAPWARRGRYGGGRSPASTRTLPASIRPVGGADRREGGEIDGLAARARSPPASGRTARPPRR